MKNLIKILSLALTVILTLSLMVACNSPDKNPPPSVSTNEVINQSISQLEDMMDIERGGGGAQPTAFVVPNHTVDYENERLSVLRGSGIALYFTEYIANQSNSFNDETIYKDTVSEQGITVSFYAKKAVVDGGVHVSLEMHQSVGGVEMVNPIQIYFEYDYAAKKPTKTTIVAVTENSSSYGISLAQFNYAEEIAYSYNFVVSATDKDSVKTALAEKSFDFAKLSACNIGRYVFAKLHPDNGTIESYGYVMGGTDEILANEADISALYSSIYNEVKNACVPVALLNPADASEKVFYVAMWSYGSERISVIK